MGATWITREQLDTLIGRTSNYRVIMQENILTPAVVPFGSGLSAGTEIRLPKTGGGYGAVKWAKVKSGTGLQYTVDVYSNLDAAADYTDATMKCFTGQLNASESLPADSILAVVQATHGTGESAAVYWTPLDIPRSL